jgi:cyclic beta-1,2-glucan synthetase
MFEYLMPLLLQRSFAGSLLEKAARDAVAIQIAYGRKYRVPWGISESAYTDLDVNKTYQYKAFGVPELGLKRGQEEELVIAPYASLLAVSLAPRETVHNLKRLASLGLQPPGESRRQARGDCTGVHGTSPGHGISLIEQFPPWQSRPTPFPC